MKGEDSERPPSSVCHTKGGNVLCEGVVVVLTIWIETVAVDTKFSSEFIGTTMSTDGSNSQNSAHVTSTWRFLDEELKDNLKPLDVSPKKKEKTTGKS